MDAVFKKRDYKEQKVVYSVNYPATFESHLNSIAAWAKTDVSEAKEIEFVVIFVITQA